MVKPRTLYAHLTDEELLAQVKSNGSTNPIEEELCQRLENFLDAKAKASDGETTYHKCPKCHNEIAVRYNVERTGITLKEVSE